MQIPTSFLRATLAILVFQVLISGLVGQELIENGYVVLEVTEVDATDQNVASQLEMMKGTEMTYYFSSDKSLVKTSMMGGMINIHRLINKTDETNVLLFDMMGQKMLVESTKEERAQIEIDGKKNDFSVEYDDSESKEILGMKCRKAILTGGEENQMKFEMYLTEQLNLSGNLIEGLGVPNIKGFPLEYVMDLGQMKMTYEAIEVVKELDVSVFDLDTEGYEKMGFEEFTTQMKGMSGMGF